jgi:hypothetical protein
MSVCTAARAGARVWLRTLPGFVLCGGRTETARGMREAWRLNLETLRWEPVPAMMSARVEHACCAVRGTIVVLGGGTTSGPTASVEMLSTEEGAFVSLPRLVSGNATYSAAAIAVEESDSNAGEVLLLGGWELGSGFASTVNLADLASGSCEPQADLIDARSYFAAARLPDGRVVCAGGVGDGWARLATAEIWGPPPHGALDAAWAWRELPAMSVDRKGCRGQVMSDGRTFAVLGGTSGDDGDGDATSSCEVLTLGGGDDYQWWGCTRCTQLTHSLRAPGCNP